MFLESHETIPSEDEYNAAGWFKNRIASPNIPENQVVISRTYKYDADSNSIVCEYEYGFPPPPPKIFSKLKLYAALSQAGLWNEFEQWLKN